MLINIIKYGIHFYFYSLILSLLTQLSWTNLSKLNNRRRVSQKIPGPLSDRPNVNFRNWSFCGGLQKVSGLIFKNFTGVVLGSELALLTICVVSADINVFLQVHIQFFLHHVFLFNVLYQHHLYIYIVLGKCFFFL